MGWLYFYFTFVRINDERLYKLDYVVHSVASKYPEFLNVLENNGEDQLGRSCEKRRSIRQSKGGEELPAYNK